MLLMVAALFLEACLALVLQIWLDLTSGAWVPSLWLSRSESWVYGWASFGAKVYLSWA
ncbi:hypothetical protein RchiOBHm_Chr7g0243241 [Rosa chinensis]|uniref:Uncharacterized protein n=1 Tax=Rosa chinensis TaxID=74649 RepID=A0A2P6PIN8_ROSCH|nr:hypothetical protein RchiOBHm_Chr7g0243241 [Rosa chinensis]